MQDQASPLILPGLLFLFLQASLAQTVNDELYKVCSMRIIVDQWMMKDWNADRSVMALIVENHINTLNYIYKENVRYKGRLLRFKVKEKNLEFRDAAWCAKNKNSVSCKNPTYWRSYTPNDFLKEQQAEAGHKNSDVCLVYFFISHTFKEGHGGTIGLAFVDRLCKGYQGANMGFVLFNHKTNNDDKHIETKFIFAHEVGHNLGLYHDGPCGPLSDGSKDPDEFCRIGEQCKAPYKNLMAPQSAHSFKANNIELSSCSLQMFEKLPRESSDWDCLVDQELLYKSDDNTLSYILSAIILVLVIVVVVLGVLLCHPRDLLASYLPGHTRVGRTYTSARRYTATARKSVAVGAVSAGRRMSVATAPLRRMTSVNRPAPNAPERPPVRRDLKPASVQSQRSTDSGGGRSTQSGGGHGQAPKVLTSSPGGAKRTGQKKSGPSQNVPPPSTGFQGSNQKPAPHFQSPSSPKFQSPKAPAHGVQSTGPGSHIGSPHQHQGPRIAPYQTGQWQPGFPQRSPTGGGEQSSPQRSRGGGEGSPKSRPFIPLQPR